MQSPSIDIGFIDEFTFRGNVSGYVVYLEENGGLIHFQGDEQRTD